MDDESILVEYREEQVTASTLCGHLDCLFVEEGELGRLDW